MQGPKRVICYGDSNTWGQVPDPNWESAPPRQHNEPWPWILQRILGSDYTIFNEGLPGRTLATPDSTAPHLCGLHSLGSVLGTRDPADLIILLLGTNDAKKKYQITPDGVISDAERIQQIQKNFLQVLQFIGDKRVREFPLLKAPRILVVAPPPTLDLHPEDPTKGINSHLSRALGKALGHVVAAENKRQRIEKGRNPKSSILFLDVKTLIASSLMDGVHWEAEDHEVLANALECYFADYDL
jgi:lysophospholipase L1-like esterase